MHFLEGLYKRFVGFPMALKHRITLSCFLAILRTGSLFFYNSEQKLLNNSPLLFLVLFILRIVFYTTFFTVLIECAFRVIRYKEDLLFSTSETDHINRVLADYGILFLGWLPNLLIKYPGALCWDTWKMISGYRKGYLDAHHSIFFSWLLGKSIDYFERIGQANKGLFLIALLQYLLYVFVFGYSLRLLRKMGFRREIWLLVMVFWLLCPYVIAYHGVVIKDTPYAAMVFMFTMLLIEISLEDGVIKKSRYLFLLVFLSALGACLMRKNGIYTVVLTAAFAFPYLFRKRKNSHFKIGFFIAILCSIISLQIINGTLKSQYELSEGSIKEALSLPFQQTARYVKYHEDDITDEERAVIDAVLKYDTLAERYNPRISDPVKSGYTEKRNMLPDYFKVWFKQFFRHPLCYVAATWEQSYYCFVPEASRDSIALYQDDALGYELGVTVDLPKVLPKHYEKIFANPPQLQHLKEWIIREYAMLHESFIIGFFSNVSVNIFAFMILFGVAVSSRKVCLIPFLPGVFSFLFIVLGPVIQGHPRYAFPIIYAIPSLTAYIVVCKKKY